MKTFCAADVVTIKKVGRQTTKREDICKSCQIMSCIQNMYIVYSKKIYNLVKTCKHLNIYFSKEDIQIVATYEKIFNAPQSWEMRIKVVVRYPFTRETGTFLFFCQECKECSCFWKAAQQLSYPKVIKCSSNFFLFMHSRKSKHVPTQKLLHECSEEQYLQQPKGI